MPLIWLSFAVQAQAAPWAAIYPTAVEPGGVFQVKVGMSGGIAAGSEATYNGRTESLHVVRGVPRALFGVPASTRAGSYPVVVKVDGQTLRKTIRVKKKTFPSQNIRMQPGKTNLMDPKILAREREILDAAWSVRSPAPFWTDAFLVPSPGRNSSAWGRRRTVNGRNWGQHQGADISAPAGTPIKATNAGRIVVAQELWMRGNTVVIDHGLGVFSAYNHLNRIDVSEGEEVARGQQIGVVGSTGFSTGPHLHWEMRIGATSVNPWPIVKNGLPIG